MALTTIYNFPHNRQDEFSNRNLKLPDEEAIIIKINMDIGAAIREKMSEQGTTIAWLARKVNRTGVTCINNCITCIFILNSY